MTRLSHPPPFAALVLLAPVLLAGCGGGDVEEAATPTSPAAAEVEPEPPAFDGHPAFEEVAAPVGLTFTRFDGRTPDEKGVIEGGRRMFEWPGGGVAAFDHDADGAPDLLFTQGREWGEENDPPGSAPDPAAPADRRDRLFRNVATAGGRRFEDVTDAAGLVLTGFGQGAAAGDFDGDGFADLYICNAGANRLLRNNGDGTYTDVTESAGLGGSDWTASAAVADLNADGLPDLYDANYLTGPEVFTLVCVSGDDPPRACNPQAFPAAADRLWLNLGTGRFADVSEEAGLAAAAPDAADPAGPGLGVTVTDFDGAPGNEVFVANDQRANHFYTRGPTAGPGGVPKLTEAALAAGVATGGSAALEACMGVACGDADGDGAADLFVTNFADQSNTLYLGRPANGSVYFEDATRPAGLQAPGYDTLGFGAAFIDYDSDGAEDLTFVNGHLDDFSYDGVLLFMKPALLKNAGGGTFDPVPPAAAGAFYDTPALGRGLARLDWDGDGREEVAVSHLSAPAALLRNFYDGGARISLRLAGTAGDRDAVGAAVTVTVRTAEGIPGGPRTKRITAGDGYMCSDEKRLAFGLGAVSAGAALSVSVRWPGGAVETFDGVTAGGRFLLVEGRGIAVAEAD